MNFKNFDQYVSQYSNDFSSFSNKVSLATSESLDFPYFNYLNSSYDLNESDLGTPIIISEGFAFTSENLNESFTYNLNASPMFETVVSDLSNMDFIPKECRNIRDIKKLKFPVTAYHKNGHDDFKTVGKLRSSEGIYNRFREKIVPKTKFKVLSFKGDPISIVETINKFPLDVNIKRFKYLNKVNEISKVLYEKYKLDFYNIELLESMKGGLYLNGVNRKLDINPHQAYKVYEAAYEDFYSAKLPNWVKKKMISESVSKYYQTKLYDSMLIKTEHTLDYSKLV